MWDPYANFQSIVLPNGLTVYVLTWPYALDSIVAGILLNVGSKDDPDGLEGLAHYVEHLVAYNIPGYARIDVSDFFSKKGGDCILGETGYHSTFYKFFIPLDRGLLNEALNIFGSMLLRSEMGKNIESERSVILKEFERKFPSKRLLTFQQEARKVIFSGHDVQRFTSSLGIPKTIRAIQVDDITKFYQQYYNPSNLSIVVVSRLAFDEVVEFVATSPFSVIRGGKSALILTPRDFPPVGTGKRVVRKHTEKPAPQYISYESAASLPGVISYDTMAIMSFMLKHVLMHKIREEKQWTYEIDVPYQNFVTSYELRIVSEALGLEAFHEIDDIINQSVDLVAEDLGLFSHVKEALVRQHNIMDLDISPMSVLNGAVSDLTANGKVIALEDEKSGLSAVSMDDICRVAEYLKPEHRFTLIQKP